MSQVTSAQTQDLSSQTFLTSLGTNAAILTLELVAFIFLKHRVRRIYEPRTYLPPPEKRAVDLPPGWWRWLLAILAIPTGDVLHKNGLDAYMFLRFLRMLIILFGSITILACAVLLPVDTAGLPNAKSSDTLSRLSWGNIPNNATGRYAAHVTVVYISTFWALFLIRRELKHYTVMRQQFLISRPHASLAQARTVLITSIPPEMCDEKELQIWASFVPGGVQNIWVYRDTTSLNEDHNNRLEACKKLEGAISKLIRKVILAKHKADRKQEKQVQRDTLTTEPKRRHKDGFVKRRRDNEKEAGGVERERDNSHRAAQSVPDTQRENDITQRQSSEHSDDGWSVISTSNDHSGPSQCSSSRPLRQRTITSELEAGQLPPSPALSATRVNTIRSGDGRTEAEVILDTYAPAEKRPHHRLGFLGLWGEKVDTIEWCKTEISRLNRSIDEKREALATAETKPKPMGSAFIQCNLQMGAHVLAQCVSYHQPLMMSEKWIEVSPKDVIWDNIDDGAYETRFRYVTSWMGSILLILIWFAPVALVGTLSNVTTLCAKVSWLCWIRNAPTPIPGIIQGILPPLFLAILFAILPLLLKGLAWYENIPRWSLLSISVYKRYFFFLVIHGFLIVTISSGLASTASQLVENPTEAVTTLASQLPNASIFFLTWTLTQGLTGAGSALLQIGQLLGHFVKKWLFGRTPRQAYSVTFQMPKADFGLVLPRLSLLATIALAYSVLSPIINGLATVSFILFFLTWKFLLTWVFDQPDESETGGQYFPLAISFLFAGLYIEQFCLAALFFLSISKGLAFIAEGILMIVLMGLTLGAQLLFRHSFYPITQHLPMSLATKSLQERWERQRKHSGAARRTNSDDDVMDLFSRDRLRSIMHRRIAGPVAQVAKNMKEGAAKVAMFSPTLKPVDADTESVYEDAVSTASAIHDLPAQRASEEPTVTLPPSSRSNVQKFPEAVTSSEREGDELQEDEPDEDFDVHGFDHPSTYEPQPWIWIPRDPLGLSQLFMRELQAEGVFSSDEGATVDIKGTVEVERTPPDENWVGGHDA